MTDQVAVATALEPLIAGLIHSLTFWFSFRPLLDDPNEFLDGLPARL